MKTTLTLFLFLIIANFAIAQWPTILNTDLPQPGDTFVLKVDITTPITITSPSGNAQDWDYSAINNDSTRFATYGITSSLDFGDDFPTSNLYTYGPAILYAGPGTPVAEWGYMMFSNESEGFYVVGYRSNYDGKGEKNVYRTPIKELVFKTPCNYADISQDSTAWEVNFNYNNTDQDTIYRSITKKTVEADAYGSLITPTATYPSVLRIHEYSISVDSVYVTVLGNVIAKEEFKRDTVNSYSFLAKDLRHPVCVIEANPQDEVESIAYLYESKLLNVSENSTPENNVKVYPNPFSETTRIEFDNKNNETYKLQITDITGKLIETKQTKDSFININKNSIQSGLYLYKLENIETKAIYNGKLIIN